jgi:hypothetical protein
VSQLPDLSQLSHAEKDALIQTLWQRLEAAEQRIAELEVKLGQPPKRTREFQPATIAGVEAQSSGEDQTQRGAPGQSGP